MPGIEPSPDRILLGRMFAYLDTQFYRYDNCLIFFCVLFVIGCTEPLDSSSSIQNQDEDIIDETGNESLLLAGKENNHSSLPETNSPSPPPVPARRYQQSNDDGNGKSTPAKLSTIMNSPKFHSTGSVRSLLAKKWNFSNSTAATIKRSPNHSLGELNYLTYHIY